MMPSNESQLFKFQNVDSRNLKSNLTMHRRFNTTFCKTPKKSLLKPLLPPCSFPSIVNTQNKLKEQNERKNDFKLYMTKVL